MLLPNKITVHAVGDDALDSDLPGGIHYLVKSASKEGLKGMHSMLKNHFNAWAEGKTRWITPYIRTLIPEDVELFSNAEMQHMIGFYHHCNPISLSDAMPTFLHRAHLPELGQNFFDHVGPLNAPIGAPTAAAILNTLDFARNLTSNKLLSAERIVHQRQYILRKSKEIVARGLAKEIQILPIESLVVRIKLYNSDSASYAFRFKNYDDADNLYRSLFDALIEDSPINAAGECVSWKH